MIHRPKVTYDIPPSLYRLAQVIKGVDNPEEYLRDNSKDDISHILLMSDLNKTVRKCGFHNAEHFFEICKTSKFDINRRRILWRYYQSAIDSGSTIKITLMVIVHLAVIYSTCQLAWTLYQYIF